MMSNEEIVRFAAAKTPNLEFHDGGLRPAVGVHCVQVVRSNREHPEEADGVGNTYNHAPNLTYWKKRFYLAYLSNPVSEHTGPGQTFLCVSEDAGRWSKPTSLFPPYPLDLSLDNGPGAERFEEGACACMHQRMNFYIAKDG
ncbi:MAG TPA: six-hairpin glycosidase, partial [Clostridia bacterium]|nr:six-hairpin glycosidase [Clostridia bacterium]